MSDQPNIVLTGFMGTGKSAVGHIVAERLGRPFVDMDAEIERRAGKSIAAIFADEGEAVFRRMEAELCRELAARRGLVVATGGGALTFPHNRRVLAASGILICLDATVDDILQRLNGMDDRPLLAGADRRQRIEALLQQRAAAYAAIPQHIFTGGLTAAQVAERVIQMTQTVTLPVRTPDGAYDILVGPRLLDRLGTEMAQRGLQGPVAVVTNETLAPLYGERVVAGLAAAGFRAHLCTVPDGEQHKNLHTVVHLYDQLLAAGLERHSTLVALGGGVVGDVAGFAAATFLRGIACVPAPTTLLAMVDASVGGKTGVDLPQGKNLVGAFKQPALVLADTETLHTLPPAEVAAGLAEVVKHGLIGNPDLFARLERGETQPVGAWLPAAIQVKIDVVEADPYESGRRAVLNLGHTFAHAIEQVTHYAWRHGDAVAVGLVAAARLSAQLEECDSGLTTRIEATLRQLHLPTAAPGLDPAALLAAMGTDKKRQAGRLRFVLLRAPGDVFLRDDVPTAAVLETLQAIVRG